MYTNENFMVREQDTCQFLTALVTPTDNNENVSNKNDIEIKNK
jgi:hypothetical protein